MCGNTGLFLLIIKKLCVLIYYYRVIVFLSFIIFLKFINARSQHSSCVDAGTCLRNTLVKTAASNINTETLKVCQTDQYTGMKGLWIYLKYPSGTERNVNSCKGTNTWKVIWWTFYLLPVRPCSNSLRLPVGARWRYWMQVTVPWWAACAQCLTQLWPNPVRIRWNIVSHREQP